MRLQRHQLLWLSDTGWRHVQEAGWDPQARDCVAVWAEQRWPLVVTRQRSVERIALGLPAPLRFGRRRLSIDVEPAWLRRRGLFPAAAVALARDAYAHGSWSVLCSELTQVGCAARVYGGYGWQALTGLDYVHDASDVDLLLPVASAAAADAVCGLLSATRAPLPRLDGELVFADGGGVAWREWVQWRSGRGSKVLIKRLDGAALESPRVPEGALAC